MQNTLLFAKMFQEEITFYWKEKKKDNQERKE